MIETDPVSGPRLLILMKHQAVGAEATDEVGCLARGLPDSSWAPAGQVLAVTEAVNDVGPTVKDPTSGIKTGF